jgi:steroid Delta-isomerase
MLERATEVTPNIARIQAMFEQLTPASLAQLGSYYTPDAQFKDPFNQVQGVAGITAVFQHMFDTLDKPRFVVKRVVESSGASESSCFLTWDFLFHMRRFNRAEQCIHGGSLLLLAPDGRIYNHRDYWDAAEELYEKLPVLGGLMRWLKKRAVQ